MKIAADDSLKYLSYFSQKSGFDISCKLSNFVWNTKAYFQGKIREKNSLSSAECVHRVVNVNGIGNIWKICHFYKESSFVNSCLLSCTPILFSKGVDSKRGNEFFPFREDLFSEKDKQFDRVVSLITKTYLCNSDPLKPHFYIVKLGFTGVYIIFLISAQKHRLWVLVRTASARRF